MDYSQHDNTFIILHPSFWGQLYSSGLVRWSPMFENSLWDECLNLLGIYVHSLTLYFLDISCAHCCVIDSLWCNTWLKYVNQINSPQLSALLSACLSYYNEYEQSGSCNSKMVSLLWSHINVLWSRDGLRCVGTVIPILFCLMYSDSPISKA